MNYHQKHYLKNKELYIQRARINGARKIKLLQSIARSAKDKDCLDCGVRYPSYVMQFDHRDGEIKCFNVADYVWKEGGTVKKLQDEIDKCDVVCANCHAERTYQRKNKSSTPATRTGDTPDACSLIVTFCVTS